MSSAAVVIGTLRVKKKITEGTEKKIMIKIKKKKKKKLLCTSFSDIDCWKIYNRIKTV